jgi:hypothetical protein
MNTTQATVHDMSRIDRHPVGWSWLLACVGLMGLWMLARPYTGVRHDGVLYLGQIYLRLQPEIFKRDLFFAYGSQDQYSLFSSICAYVHQWLGQEGSQFLVLLLSHCVLMLAAAWLLKPLGTVAYRVLGLVALAVMPHFYGGMGIFSYAETFVTARTLAEPIGLVALALLVHGHRLGAAMAAVAAALLHPLMALPVLVVGWLAMVQEDRRWLWLSVPAAVMTSAIAIAGVGPAANLSRRYDDAWLAVVQTANPFVFPLGWAASSWALVVGVLLFLHLGGRLLPFPLARLSRAASLGATLLMVVSILGSDVLHNILLTQLQLWRALWVAHLLAIVLLPAVVWRLWSLGGPWRTVAVAIAAAAVALTAEWPSSPLILAWVLALCLLARMKLAALGGREWTWLLTANIAVMLLLSALLLLSNLRQLLHKGVDLDVSVIAWSLATTPLLVLALAWWTLERTGSLPRPRLWGGILALGLLVTGAADWDRRTDTQRIVEARPGTPHPFALKTEPDSQIYWGESLNHTWAMLGRVSYFTDHQGSGVLFERQTAMEFERRRQVFSKLSFQRQICMMLAGLEQNPNWAAECVPDVELVIEVCRTDRGPDYLVFPFALPRGSVASWTLAPGDAPPTSYHLHDCAKLR